jgi:hypothetical protein
MRMMAFLQIIKNETDIRFTLWWLINGMPAYQTFENISPVGFYILGRAR